MSATLALLAAAAVCTVPAGWDTVAARNTRYVVFGELHGTAQTPALIGDTACALASKGQRILVAIEQNSEDDAALQTVWRGPDKGFAAALRALPNWVGRNDGVGSVAMFAMLVRLHRVRSTGGKIDVVAFNPGDDTALRARFQDLPGQGPHEAGQAENIRRAADAGHYDRVLVLTGNIHARTLPIERGGFSFAPMAMRLAPRSDVTALDMRTQGGTSWGCRMSGRPTPGQPIDWSKIVCAAYPLRADRVTGAAPRIALRPVPTSTDLDPAYDGYYFLDRVTASPPEVPGK